MIVHRSLRFRLIFAAGVLSLASCLCARAQDGSARQGDGPMGQGVGGTVIAVSGPDVTIKTEEGDNFKVSVNVNTRIMKERVPAKAADIHNGDMLVVGGVVDAKAKTVAAAFVAIVDAEQVRKMREDLGKTWIAGRVTAIVETKVTIHRIDGADQTISVDENTSFRSHRESVTLADIKVGDSVNARGQIKDGTFVAAELGVGRGRMMGAGGRGAGTGSDKTSTGHAPR